MFFLSVVPVGHARCPYVKARCPYFWARARTGPTLVYPHLFLSVNACQSEFNSRVHAWCTCIWTHFFTCKSENLNLCFWICEIIAAPKRLHSSTQKQIVFICFISFVYTLNTKGTWMQTLWRRNQVIHYVFNFFPIRIRKIHLLVLLHYASTPSTHGLSSLSQFLTGSSHKSELKEAALNKT